MKVAVLSDIHGNLPAFEAVLDHLSQQKVDLTVIAGDIVVGAPDSAACWRLARSLPGVILLRGNHERYVADYGTAAAEPGWSTPQYAPVQWAVAQLAEAERAEMSRLQLAYRLPNLLIVHASLRNDRDTITGYTPDDEITAMFPHVTERYIVRAHNHLSTLRLWREHFIITSGSVGLPLDANPAAQYLLLEQHPSAWNIRHQAVPYDLEAAIRRFHDTGYLEATGPMGRLFLREVMTATPHFVPFLRLYNQWSQAGMLSLEAALARFLAH